MLKSVKTILSQYKRKKALRELNKQAHLRVLSDQLSPHFVFNALNNLRFMLLLDKGRAKQMALDISDIVEDMELIVSQQQVSLQTELRLLNKYLRLVSTQLGDGFCFDLRVSKRLSDHELETLWVLPLILQLLAENAVKHGLNLVNRGRLLIQVRVFGEYLLYRMTNTLPDSAICDEGDQKPADSYAIGVRNIRQRLQALYPGQYVFRLKQANQASALVIFPLSNKVANKGDN